MDWGLFSALDSREDAVVVWLIASAVFVAAKGDGIGGSVAGVLRALASWKVGVVFASAAVYCAVIVAAAYVRGWWHMTALKETIYWFVISGLVLVGNALTASPERYFNTLVRKALRATVAVEILVNLYVFPFIVEIFLVPFIALLVISQVMAESMAEYARAKPYIDGFLAVIGFTFIVYVMLNIAADFDAFLTRENAENFLIAPAMTLAIIPLCLVWAWISRREQERLRARFRARSAFS